MEFAETLPKQIGNVKLNYEFYPGEDIYSDGAIEDEILDITKNAARIEYPKIIEEKNSWPVLYHLSALRGPPPCPRLLPPGQAAPVPAPASHPPSAQRSPGS